MHMIPEKTCLKTTFCTKIGDDFCAKKLRGKRNRLNRNSVESDSAVYCLYELMRIKSFVLKQIEL